MRRKPAGKLLSILLTVMMVLTALPLSACAAPLRLKRRFSLAKL